MKKYHHRIKLTMGLYHGPDGQEVRTYFVLQSKRFWFNSWTDRSFEYTDIWPLINIVKCLKNSKTSLHDIKVVRHID